NRASVSRSVPSTNLRRAISTLHRALVLARRDARSDWASRARARLRARLSSALGAGVVGPDGRKEGELVLAARPSGGLLESAERTCVSPLVPARGFAFSGTNREPDNCTLQEERSCES